jgi:hypothetical protein
MRLENGAGRYLDAEMFSMLHLSGKEGIKDLFAATANEEKTMYRLRMGGEEYGTDFDRLAVFSREGDSRRSEKMYVFKDSKRDRGSHSVEWDINGAFCEFTMKNSVPDGGTCTTKPLFCIFTERELSLEALDDLSRIEF